MGDYGRDLAYIHDAGYLQLAREATPFATRLLRRRGVEGGRVVELGCGSGETARALTEAGFDVLGIDSSRAMVEMARSRAPRARFRVGSWAEAELPPCDAVLAFGEVLAYTGAARGTMAELRAVARRVREALAPRGHFVFDLPVPGRVRGGEQTHARMGDDWGIVSVATERGRRLERRITSFRRIAGGATYRRTEEVHRLALHDPQAVASMLRRQGFRVQLRRGYAPDPFVPGLRVFVARRA